MTDAPQTQYAYLRWLETDLPADLPPPLRDRLQAEIGAEAWAPPRYGEQPTRDFWCLEKIIDRTNLRRLLRETLGELPGFGRRRARVCAQLLVEGVAEGYLLSTLILEDPAWIYERWQRRHRNGKLIVENFAAQGTSAGSYTNTPPVELMQTLRAWWLQVS